MISLSLVTTAMLQSAELWNHLTTELSTRDAQASIDQAQTLQIETSSKLSWASIAPPAGGWDLSLTKHVQAEVTHLSGTKPAKVTLWVVSSNGWSAVGGDTVLTPKESSIVTCDLRKIYPDGTPMIDPSQIAEIRIMVQQAPDSIIEVTDLKPTGQAPPWIRPEGRIDVPEPSKQPPAAGHRVFYQIAPSSDKDLYSVLYLPNDWQPHRSYPVIAEFPDNVFYDAQ
ncbi:MAG: hypothetical protein AAF226_04995, partial [Verrucomicrobiota bacterium]